MTEYTSDGYALFLAKMRRPSKTPSRSRARRNAAVFRIPLEVTCLWARKRHSSKVTATAGAGKKGDIASPSHLSHSQIPCPASEQLPAELSHAAAESPSAPRSPPLEGHARSQWGWTAGTQGHAAVAKQSSSEMNLCDADAAVVEPMTPSQSIALPFHAHFSSFIFLQASSNPPPKARPFATLSSKRSRRISSVE